MNISSLVTAGPPREIPRPWGKEAGQTPCERGEQKKFGGLNINFGKLLLVYFMRPPDLEVL